MDVVLQEQIIDERAAEINLYLENGDVGRAMRRLLDFLTDFPVSPPLKETALRLRGEYYLANEGALRGSTVSDEVRQDFISTALELAPVLAADARRNLASGVVWEKRLENNVVFQGKGLSKSFKTQGAAFTLDSVDVTLKLGELTGLLGENGNGKTVLLRIIAGEFAADAGTLTYPLFDADDWYDIKRHIAYIPQQLTAWNGALIDVLHFAAAIHGIKGRENEALVEFYLQRLGLEKYRHAKWKALSGGYKMRFELARMLVWRPKLIVLDEPLANLDVNAQLTFLQDLKDLSRSTRYPFSVIISSQHLHEIENVADNLIFIKQGRVLYSGPTNDFDAHRGDNTFELGCDISPAELYPILRDLAVQSIQDTGQGVIINCPLEIEAETILNRLIEAKVKVRYFRDVSQSTRKLFRQE